MQKLSFPSTRAAWQFSQDLRAEGYHPRFAAVARPITKKMFIAALIGALIGGAILCIVGILAEQGKLGLPRLEPLFASPPGAVAALLAVIGGSFGAAIGGLIGMEAAPSISQETPVVEVDRNGKMVDQLAQRYGGNSSTEGAAVAVRKVHKMQHNLNLNRILAWLLVVLTAGVILEATTYIWFLSINYGHGADQASRIGYTMKNVQRVHADNPEEVGQAMQRIYGGDLLQIPADPLTAAVMAPLAAWQGQTLVYGGGDAQIDLSLVRQLAESSNVAVIVAEEELAYAMPAAYTAALFRVPVVPFSLVDEILPPDEERFLFVAAPAALIDDDSLETLSVYGAVERVADDDIYRHALLWVRNRWGNFGWGINENEQHDGYYNFTLTNPADPNLAAAALPQAYLGNFGPLLYSEADELSELTDQFLWRISPDYFAIPSDGPFMNVRVVGSPDDVSYSVQARADLALETHAYRNQVTGMSGMAALGWMWFSIGLAGFTWALFAMPKRLPDTGFYPRLYWPLTMLWLGPIGILAFLVCYQNRPVEPDTPMPRFIRPSWAMAVSATIMGMSVGMALMIASMYLFQLNGMPLFTGLAWTNFFWLGSPMTALMWFLMVVPAILLSTFFFMGPMMGEMHGVGYWQGVKKAFPVVFWSMVAASIGMWTLTWWWMNWKGLMSEEDIWLWVTPLWWASFMGFLTALIPNYWMVFRGWKNGGM